MDAIRVSIGGVEVSGVVRRYPYDFTVTIKEPYRNLTSGLHIPYFARGHLSFDGEYGNTRILQILEELYALGKYLEKEKDRLQAIIRGYEGVGDGSPLEAAVGIEGQKKELKKRLRKGEITSREYQEYLSPLHQGVEKCEQKAWAKLDSFFEDHFPMLVPAGTRENVVAILKGKKSLVIG